MIPLRILIADDHPVIREGLRGLLTAHPHMAVVAEAGTGDEVMAHLACLTVDLLLLDLSMPGLTGLEVLQRVRKHHPTVKVIVVTMHSEARYAARVFRAGALGYVVKDMAGEELIEAIEKVAAGGRYVGPRCAEILAEQVMDDTGPPHTRLSTRELEVLILLAQGYHSNEIAKRLGLTGKTISVYRAKVLEKLNLRRNAELTQYAAEHELI